MKRTDTQTLIDAMRVLARDVQCDGGVANAAIAEAADRLEELHIALDRMAIMAADLDAANAEAAALLRAKCSEIAMACE